MGGVKGVKGLEGDVKGLFLKLLTPLFLCFLVKHITFMIVLLEIRK